MVYNKEMEKEEKSLKERDVKILAVVGMSGSGKSVVVEKLSSRGVPKVYFGGIVLKEMEKRGIERTAESEKEFREMIRASEGSDWVVRRVIENVKRLIAAGQKRIVLDGVYSWTEYLILKEAFPGVMVFVAVVMDRKLRYARVEKRVERAFNGREIRERDYSEIQNLEKGGPIAMADYFVLNNGTKEELETQIEEVLEKAEF